MPSRPTLSLDPRDPAFIADPYSAYAEMHRSHPVFHWEEIGCVCFARHADVNALLRDRRFGRQIHHVASREELGWPEAPAHMAPVCAFERHALLELEPPEHTRLRALVNRAFTPRSIEPLAPRIEVVARGCIDQFSDTGEIELIEQYATPIPVIVIAEMLGVPIDMAPQLLAWSHDMVAIYQVRRDEAIERRAAHATVEFMDYMREHIRQRRGRTEPGLLADLLNAMENGERLSEDELVSTVILLLNAGHEATVHAIANGVKTLLDHEVDTRALLGDPVTGPKCVEEILRFAPPLHLFKRYALEDLEFGGIRFRKGDQIGLLLAAANRDPERFPDPGRFDPDRSPNPHVSFGVGIHFCVGAPLARLELLIALRVLFEALPGLRVAESPRFRDTWHFHGVEQLHVQW